MRAVGVRSQACPVAAALDGNERNNFVHKRARSNRDLVAEA
jgi:hypothetical protein